MDARIFPAIIKDMEDAIREAETPLTEEEIEEIAYFAATFDYAY